MSKSKVKMGQPAACCGLEKACPELWLGGTTQPKGVSLCPVVSLCPREVQAHGMGVGWGAGQSRELNSWIASAVVTGHVLP